MMYKNASTHWEIIDYPAGAADPVILFNIFQNKTLPTQGLCLN